MDDLNDFCAAVLKGLAQPNRLKIIEALRDDELCQADIASKICEKQPNTSRHLTALYMAGILTPRRVGPQIFYRLRYPEVLSIFDFTKKIVAQELNSYHHLAVLRGMDKKTR